MAANSIVLLPSESHADSNAQPIENIGEKQKGAGYYGMNDGFHTVQIQLTSFIGTVKIQGSLAADPAEEDWVDVRMSLQGSSDLISSLIYATASSPNVIYNFVGNFVWLRASVTNWTTGSINRILLNF